MENFLKIGITLPGFVGNEAGRIMELLESGVIDLCHIRKPDWDYETTASLIKLIPPELHSKLKIHDHFELMDKFELYGVHLNERNPSHLGHNKNVSKSCHKIEELENIQDFDYVTLSPIYDSISKKGYQKSFELEKLKTFLKGKNVIALGGVTPNNFEELRQAGFSGAALSGYLFLT